MKKRSINPIKVRIYKSYFHSNRYKSHIRISDSKPANTLDISQFINALSVPLDVVYSLDKLKKDSKIFGRIRAAKRANLMSEKKKHPQNPSQRLVAEEKYASKIYEINSSETGSIYQGIFTISPESTNPVKLREYTFRIRNSLELMGASLNLKKRFPRSYLGKLNSFNFVKADRYLIDSQSLVCLIPWFTDSVPDTSGILIGLDSYSGKPIFLNLWARSSFNSIILGEIGSGKSYFTKTILLRNLLLDLADEIYIFDPMNEYFLGKSLSPYSDVEIISFSEDTANKILLTSNANKNKIIRIFRFMENAKTESNFLLCLSEMFDSIKKSESKRKLMIIDEAHLLLRYDKTMKLFGEIVRSSRHYLTSVFSISQGIGEFLSSQGGQSIFENSINVFIFRNKFWENLKDAGIDPAEYGYLDFKNLSGGKGESYSEFFYYTNGNLRKLAYISTDFEKKFID